MELIRMRVGARRALTPQITEFTLVPMEEGALAGFTPGPLQDRREARTGQPARLGLDA